MRTRSLLALWLSVTALSALSALTACNSSSTARSTPPAELEGARQSSPLAVASRPWPHETSDIPVDPRIRFGALPNGLRYAWMVNAEPDERCYAYLHVDVGSLAEKDDEQGLAHFLEHMAFNGTRDYPGTSLIEWFQRHGMGFGADSNAHTSFSETVYELNLPKSDAQTLGEGLHVLREFAGSLVIDPAEVEHEKGVIDAEERERDSAAWRAQRESLERTLDGTRVPERLPIGEKVVRDRFTAAGVRAFYETWYRPDLMTLVVVGDLGDLDPTRMIEKEFSDLVNPSAPRPSEPALGRPSFANLVYAIHEPELPTESLAVARLVPYVEEPATVAEWLEDVPLDYARAMLNLRFSELAKDSDAAFLQANAGAAEMVRAIDGDGLWIACRPERWREALMACEAELRRALEFGFQAAELDEVRADGLLGLDESVEREATRSSAAYVSAIVSAAEEPYVPTRAEWVRATFRPALEALTVERCVDALREAWRKGALSITASGALDLGPDAPAELRAAWEEGGRATLEAPAAIAAQTFAYAASENAGQVDSRTHRDDLDIEDVRFQNGVRLLVKRTDFKERQILFNARIGEGQLMVAPAQLAVAWVLGQVFEAGGLRQHSADDLRRLTAGKNVSVGFGMAGDSFELGGATTADDFLLQCELVAAHVTDPGWREEGLSQFQKAVPQYYEALQHEHQGPLLLEFLPELYGGDRRFSIPTQAEVEAVTLDDLRGFFTPVLKDAPITLTVVGDLVVDDVIAAVARTFGVLPPRRALESHADRREIGGPRAGLRVERAIDTTVPQTLVMGVFPTTDGFDPVLRRNLTFLGEVYSDRLRVDVREKLGASYSPSASSNASLVWRGDGAVQVQAMAAPAEADTLLQTCLAVAAGLASGPITDDEVERVREPLLNQVRDSKRQNGFWVTRLREAHARPQALDEILTVEAHYRALRAQDLAPLASKYLQPERASVLIVAPKE